MTSIDIKATDTRNHREKFERCSVNSGSGEEKRSAGHAGMCIVSGSTEESLKFLKVKLPIQS
jgi:hypothetical protein